MKGRILHIAMVLYYVSLPIYILNILRTYAAEQSVNLNAITTRIIVALIITGIVVVMSYVFPNIKRASLKGEMQENFERKTMDRQLTYCIVGRLAGMIIIVPAVLAIMKLNGIQISPIFAGAVNPIINTVEAVGIYSQQFFIAIMIIGYMIFVTSSGIVAALNLCSVEQLSLPKAIISMIIMFIPSVGIYYNIGLKADLKKRTRRQIQIAGKIICSILITIAIMLIINFIIN